MYTKQKQRRGNSTQESASHPMKGKSTTKSISKIRFSAAAGLGLDWDRVEQKAKHTKSTLCKKESGIERC